MPLAFRSARVSLALAAALTLAAATAHAQGGPPQVTVAPPLASRVAQWDEFTGRFEAMERVEVRPRVSGYIDQVQFPRRQHRQAGRPAVHHRSAAVPTRRRFRQSRRGAHPGADRARPGRLPAGPGTGEDRRDAGQRARPAQGQPGYRPRAGDGGAGGAAHGRTQPGMVRGPRPDQRPRLRSARRSRQPGHRRSERRDDAHHDRAARSDLLRVRWIGGRLYPLHPTERRRRAGFVARHAEPGAGAARRREGLAASGRDEFR